MFDIKRIGITNVCKSIKEIINQTINHLVKLFNYQFYHENFCLLQSSANDAKSFLLAYDGPLYSVLLYFVVLLLPYKQPEMINTLLINNC